MAYTKQTWQDLPSKTTPINASRLGHIEQGIYDAASTADTAASDASSAISGLADKVDKVEGKGLSTNDFTDTLKTKLDNIEAGAEVNVQSDWDEDDTTADSYIANKPTLGTAATKNSTSVVTQSTDLVESGAVKDVVGWGNKNLLPLNYSDGNSKTQNGVTFTKNTDGTVTISIAQSATGNAYYYMYLTLEDFIERGEKYIVNDFLNNNNITFSCNDKVNNAWGNTANSNGSDAEWTPRAEATAYGIWILVASGTTAGTYIVKPMISKDGASYEPYHASVEETLTTKTDNSVIAPTENGTTASQAYAVGSHAIRNGKFITWKNAKAQGETINDVSDYTSGNVAESLDVITGIINANASVLGNNSEIIKSNGIVYLSAVFENFSYPQSSIGTSKSIGSVPEGFKPNKLKYTVATTSDGSKFAKIYISNTGNIGVYSNVELINETLQFSIAYNSN